MRKLTVFGSLLTVLASTPAGAQQSSHHLTDSQVAQPEAVPARPLTVAAGHTQHYGGLSLDLSSGVADNTFAVPFGGGFGLMPDFEIGMNINLLLKPWAIQNSLSQIRLYGRRLLIPDMLALEVAFHVPTAYSGNLGFEITAPGRYRTGPIELFGHARFMYRGGAFLDSVLLGAAATGLYTVVDRFFVAVDIGLNLRPTRIDPAIPGVEADWTTDWVLPLGIGAGYRFLDNLFAKLTFTFNDLATGDPGSPVDSRGIHLVLVQSVNLTGEDAPARPAPDESEFDNGTENKKEMTE